ncbi:U-reduvitoxin-Pr11a-like [Ruditapes philippinarum]|uniref:U-reduvitoxin-Pr11a-like n=1 Tax=Ruditapes philippinarum TaxID=129788 RepID=UPI00295AA2BC|nr:U-reduvitoxin-Pr11a-like [Ruditapes philippinarum]
MLKLLSLVCVLYSVSALLDCDYDGIIRKSGDHFPSSDGCNNCFCTNGAVACTLRFCLPKVTCTYGNATYNENDSFKALDGCNTCSCRRGMVVCTEMFCLPSTDVPL